MQTAGFSSDLIRIEDKKAMNHKKHTLGLSDYSPS